MKAVVGTYCPLRRVRGGVVDRHAGREWNSEQEGSVWMESGAVGQGV